MRLSQVILHECRVGVGAGLVLVQGWCWCRVGVGAGLVLVLKRRKTVEQPMLPRPSGMRSLVIISLCTLALSGSHGQRLDCTTATLSEERTNGTIPSARYAGNATPATDIGAIRCTVLCKADNTNASAPSDPNATSAFWTLNGQPIPASNTSGIQLSNRTAMYNAGADNRTVGFSSTLSWNGTITRQLAGNYSCGFGSGFTSFRLLVGDAASVDFVNQSAHVTAAQRVSLLCHASGASPLSLTWYKGGQSMMNSTGRSLALDFDNTTEADAGFYTCQASNTYGTSFDSVTLIFQDVPSFQGKSTRPFVLPLSMTSTSITFILTPARDGGAAPFRSYQTTCAPTAGFAFTGPVTTMSLYSRVLVTGLHPGVQYSCRYQVVNAVGASLPSLATEIQALDAIAGPPHHINATALLSTAISVMFQGTPAESSHGLVRDYVLEYSVVDCHAPDGCPCTRYKCSLSGLAFRRPDETGAAIKFTGLRHYTTYRLAVAGINGVGRGMDASVLATTEEALPGPVDALRPVTLSNSSIEVQWDAPREPNGIILYYHLQYSLPIVENSTVDLNISSTAGTWVNITDLPLDTLVFVKVAAVNSVGFGPYATTHGIAKEIVDTPDDVTTETETITAPKPPRIGCGQGGNRADCNGDPAGADSHSPAQGPLGLALQVSLPIISVAILAVVVYLLVRNHQNMRIGIYAFWVRVTANGSAEPASGGGVSYETQGGGGIQVVAFRPADSLGDDGKVDMADGLGDGGKVVMAL